MSINWFGASGAARRMDEVKQPREVILMERCTNSGSLLTVVEGEGTRALCLGTMSQTEAHVDSNGEVMLVPLVEEWVQCVVVISLAWLCDEAGSVLHCGVGGGIIPRALHEHTLSRSQCIELEPEVLAAAQSHFGLPAQNDRFTASVGDAVACLGLLARGNAGPNGEPRRFDVIIVDCFTADGLAPAVADGEILPHLSACLRPSGVCLLNLFAPPTAAETIEEMPVIVELCKCFGAVYTLKVRSSQNVIAICHHGPPRDGTAWAAHLAPADARAVSLCPDVTSERDLPSLDQRIVLVGGRGSQN